MNSSKPIKKGQIEDYISPSTQTALDLKVDKVAGERLINASEVVKLSNTSNINSGDQNSIVGISGTKAQFNASVTDGDILFVGDVSSSTNLAYTPSATNGIITSDAGTDATIPLADITNAGLITPLEKTKINTALQSSDISGLVPYTGATTNVDLGEHQVKVGQLEFDQTPTGTFGVGKVRWNDTDGTIEVMLKGGNVTLQVGQEQLLRVVNKTGVNLLESEYHCVYISGAQGNRLKVDLALSNNTVNSNKTIGLVTENIDNNQEGFVTTDGLVRNINTTGSQQSETWIDGNVLYLSAISSGHLTNIAPISPNHKVVVGYIVRAHATQGSIFVKVNTGLAVSELHDVNVTGNTANKLIGSTTEGLWENKTVSDVLGYTPIGGSGTTNRIPKFNSSNTLGDSSIFDTGNILIGTTIDNGTDKLQVAGSVGLNTAPTTSAGGYDILTRNTSTGQVEKVASSGVGSWTTTGNNIANSNINSVLIGTSTVNPNLSKFVVKGTVTGTGSHIIASFLDNSGIEKVNISDLGGMVIAHELTAGGVQLGAGKLTVSNNGGIAGTSSKYILSRASNWELVGLAKYDIDYSGSYDARSLVDKGYTETSAQTISGIKTYLNGTLGLRNVANTFTSLFTNTNTAARTYTLQDRSGTLLDSTDLSTINTSLGTKQSVFTGTTNYITKSINSTTLGISRLFDNGTFFGIGTANTPTKDFTLGNQSDKEIGVELSDSTTVGRDLILTAGKTINYSLNVNFNALSQTSRGWISSTSTPNGNVYACVGSGDIYMQTGGTGNFVSLGQTSRTWSYMAATAGGNVYATVLNGDIYMQTGGTGNFVSLGQTSRSWGGIVSSPNGNVYALGANILWSAMTTDIYMQTGGTGNFVALGQTLRRYLAISSTPNGNVYAFDATPGDVYMQNNQTAGTSDLQGGTLKLKAGTGKGTGQSKIQFVTGAKTASGTDMQIETVRAEIDEQGVFKLNSIPTYADNTTALAGGLTAGMFYRTAVGILMIVY